MEPHAVPAYLVLVAQELRREDEALVRLEAELSNLGSGAHVTKERLEATVSATRTALCYTADGVLVLAVLLEEVAAQKGLRGGDARG